MKKEGESKQYKICEKHADDMLEWLRENEKLWRERPQTVSGQNGKAGSLERHCIESWNHCRSFLYSLGGGSTSTPGMENNTSRNPERPPSRSLTGRSTSWPNVVFLRVISAIEEQPRLDPTLSQSQQTARHLYARTHLPWRDGCFQRAPNRDPLDSSNSYGAELAR